LLILTAMPSALLLPKASPSALPILTVKPSASRMAMPPALQLTEMAPA
jgi:hypothetical protein